MEEKIYFRPASYGKGIRKRKEKREIEDKGEKDHRVRNLIIFIILIFLIVLIMLWLLRGKTTTSGQYPENIKNNSLLCSSKNIKYPKITKIDSDNKELKINTIFNGTETLKSISIIYTLQYASEQEAYAAEVSSNIEFVDKLASIGFNSSKFSNKFSRYVDKLIVSLTMKPNELEETTADYAMLNMKDIEQIKAYSLNDYQEYYESLGFICENTIDNN